MQYLRFYVVYLVIIFSSGLSWLENVSAIQAIDDAVIYFADEAGLQAFSMGQNTVQTLHSSDSAIYLFSNHGSRVAYLENGQIYVSELKNWNPQMILPIDINALSFYWTPDDRRLIIKTGTPIGGNSVSNDWKTYAYSFTKNQLEIWPWGDCREFGRHIEDGHFALICWTDTWMTSSDAVIAVRWGGNYQAFDSEVYEIVIQDLKSFTPPEWSIDETERLIFIDENASGFYSISQIRYDSPITRIASVDSPQTIFSVSPKHNLIAYLITCGERQNTSCLQIAEIETGEMVWTAAETFTIEYPRDIAWLKDNKRLVVSGNHSYLRDPSIWLFDTETGNVVEFNEFIPDNTNIGSIAVISD